MDLIIHFRYVESQVKQEGRPFNPEEKWKGFFYAFLLLATTVFQVLLKFKL